MSAIVSAIVNHEVNDAAIDLIARFRAVRETMGIDSGSSLAPTQRAAFDACLPNVHYCGLLNESVERCAGHAGDTPLYFVCSDVSFDDVATACDRADAAFADPAVGVYAPSVDRSSHPVMVNRPGGRLRDACFVEGFCFAARLSLLRALCPIDLAVNRIGWGVDVQLGFLAARAGLRSVVDDGIAVGHRWESGYAKPDARAQRDRWFATLGARANWYRRLATSPLAAWPAGARALGHLARI